MDNEVEPDQGSPANFGRLENLARAASIARLTTVNLAPEAAQVHQLTTFEVLTALNSNVDHHEKTATSSAAEQFDLKGTSTLKRTPRELWDRFRSKLHTCYEELYNLIYRLLPHGINNNRLGIQWACIGAVVLIFQFITPPDHPFLGPCWLSFANFIAINALTTIEMATGATNRNALLRIIGTTLAAGISFAVLIPMIKVGWEGQDDSYMVRWIMYYACTPSPFIWNFLKYHYPTYMHENFTFQGLSTQVYLFGSSSKKIIWDMSICTIGCYIGTVVGFIGYQLVVPLRARDKLIHDLSLIVFKLSYSLEPLIEFESGTKACRSRRTSSKLPLFQKSKSKQVIYRKESKTGGGGERGSDRGSRLIRNLSKKIMGYDTSQDSPVDDIAKFRAHVWDTLTDCAKLMEDHDEVMAHARREHYYSKPHFFYYNHFKRLSSDCRALYYHVSSLFLIFQAQMSTTPTQSVYNNLARLPSPMPELATQSGIDYGGLFQQSGYLNPTEQQQPQAAAASGRQFSTSISVSPALLDDISPNGNGTFDLSSRFSMKSPITVSPPPVSDHESVDAEYDTAAADGFLENPKKLYSPFEALSACKIPKHDIMPQPSDAPALLHQMTAPALARRLSSMHVVQRAASMALIQQAYSTEMMPIPPSASHINFPSQASDRTHGELQADISSRKDSTPIDADRGKNVEMELRGALLDVVQGERAEVMGSLTNAKNIMNGDCTTMTAPQFPPTAGTLQPPTPTPTPTLLTTGSPASAQRQSADYAPIRVGGDLDLLVNSPSNTLEEAPIAPAKVIGLAPVVKWAGVFGPMFGQVAENMGYVLELIGESLDFHTWNPDIWNVLEEVDSSIDRLVSGRRNWWEISQEMASLINSNLYMKDCVADQAMYDELEEKFCIPWLGLTLDAYGRLPEAVKDDLWISFENMQDRQTMACKTCVLLTRRLRLFAESAETFLAVQFPSSNKDANPTFRESTAREQSVLSQTNKKIVS